LQFSDTEFSDICKFPIDEIMRTQKFDFATKFSSKWAFSTPIFRQEDFLTAQNFGGIGRVAIAPAPVPLLLKAFPDHDDTASERLTLSVGGRRVVPPALSAAVTLTVT